MYQRDNKHIYVYMHMHIVNIHIYAYTHTQTYTHTVFQRMINATEKNKGREVFARHRIIY